jgi:hypothetical protein
LTELTKLDVGVNRIGGAFFLVAVGTVVVVVVLEWGISVGAGGITASLTREIALENRIARSCCVSGRGDGCCGVSVVSALAARQDCWFHDDAFLSGGCAV